MIVLCNGLAKSGSSFVFQITEKLAEAAGHSQKQLRIKYIPDKFVPYKPHPFFVSIPSGQLTRWTQSVPSSHLLVVKTHDLCTEETMQLLASGQIKAINSFRDPRDASVSLWDSALKERLTIDPKLWRFNVPSFPSAIMILAHLANINAGWMRNKDTLNLGYQKIATTPYDTADNIADYLQLEENVFPLVSSYLKNRAKIREYNIGVPGRYKTYMSLFEEGWSNQLYRKYDQLINDTLSRNNN